jgi:hypothetical protein
VLPFVVVQQDPRRPSLESRSFAEVALATPDDVVFYLFFQWWFFVPFGNLGRVLQPLPVTHLQCPFIQMTDTKVTFLSCYNTVGHTPMYVMTLFSQRLLEVQKV